jgi:uncharacterized membrane-anchored protein
MVKVCNCIIVPQYDTVVMVLWKIIATNYVNRAERALAVSLSVGRAASNRLLPALVIFVVNFNWKWFFKSVRYVPSNRMLWRHREHAFATKYSS